MVARLVRYGPVRQKKTFLHTDAVTTSSGTANGSHGISVTSHARVRVRARVHGKARWQAPGTFVIEFGYICYQDTYPNVSCVYPVGYTYLDVS